MAKSLIPGVGLIRSLMSKLAFDASKTKYVIELFHIGGTKYMGQRASEMLNSYLQHGKVADLDMTIQLLATLRQMKHGPIEAARPAKAGSKNTASDSSGITG